MMVTKKKLALTGSIEVFIIVCLFFTFSSCGQDSVTERVRNGAYGKKNGDEIKLKWYTWFNWDTVYVFNPRSGQDIIENTIGERISHYREFSNFICFKYRNKVVHSEFYESGMESPNEGELDFDSLYYFGTFRCYSIAEAEFRIKPSTYTNDDIYFSLRSKKPIYWKYR